jgi:hypothetical protein
MRAFLEDPSDDRFYKGRCQAHALGRGQVGLLQESLSGGGAVPKKSMRTSAEDSWSCGPQTVSQMAEAWELSRREPRSALSS